MPFNLLILPFLGGYWLMKMSYRFRFIHQQLDRTHLIVWSSTAGLLLLLVARAVAMFGAWLMPELALHLNSSFFPLEYLGTGLLAFLLGPLTAFWLNIFDDKESVSASAIRSHGNELEKFLLDADGKELMFTLSSGKVYIGYYLSDPADLEKAEAWLRILPIYSGYRMPDTKQVKLTINYLNRFLPMSEVNRAADAKQTSSAVVNDSESVQSQHNKTKIDAFHKLIRAGDIESCSVFDIAVWDGFQISDPPAARQ